MIFNPDIFFIVTVVENHLLEPLRTFMYPIPSSTEKYDSFVPSGIFIFSYVLTLPPLLLA